jgi:hypothetical protein
MAVHADRQSADLTRGRGRAILTKVMGCDPQSGTPAADMALAFSYFGREMVCLDAYETPCAGPMLSDWLAALKPTWRRRHPLAIAIEEPGDVHWVACWGPCICDSLSYGRWLPLGSSEHRRRFVSHAHAISPAPLVAGPVKMG